MTDEIIREGDLYKSVTVEDTVFEIYYGYACEQEREFWEPSPIYPDFLSSPVYTARGYPFATAYQDVCRHYLPKPDASNENWCNDCAYFNKYEEYIGVCRCEIRRAKNVRQNE